MGVNKVQVHIEALVLDGFAPADRIAIAEGVRQELTQLIGARSLGHFAESAASVDAGSFAVTSGANGAVIGRRVAQQVGRELTRGRGGK